MTKTAKLVLLVLLATVRAEATPELDAAFPRSSIVIAAAQNCYRFDVWVALEPEQQRRGLMHVRQLEPWQGMLFVYAGEARRSMWMKNTYLPLDMLFIRADGTVSSVEADTEPLSLASVASREPVTYVLELNAGVSERLGIGAGDTLTWSGDLEAPSEDGGN